MSDNVVDIKTSLVIDWSLIFKKLLEDKPGSQLFLLTDSGSKKHCLPLVQPSLPEGVHRIWIGAGEKNKTLASCEKVWKVFTQKNADRKSVLLNLGGGMIGDLGGFCAASYKRGIEYIQIPTTLLAMVDASIGGKTGIDFQGFKNQIGTFRQPMDVWVYPEFLKTLPQAELLSGFAEVLKHCLISNQKLWNVLRKKDFQFQPWPEIISASQELKKSIVLEDPFETGTRKKLNAGHTLGHALESLFLQNQNPVPHGHCVAAGLVMETFIGLERGLISDAELIQIEEVVYSLYGVLPLKKSDKNAIWKLALQDKKNRNSEVLMALIGPIGNCGFDIPVTQNECFRAIDYYLGNW